MSQGATHYFVLKKLHSLSGVIPIAGFVLFHLFENHNAVHGPEAFTHTVEMIRGLPLIKLLEIGLLAPILFHALLGIYIAKNAKHNLGTMGNRANWMYFLQRLSGVILLVFIGVHVYTTRFADIPADKMFDHMAAIVAGNGALAFYILGIVSAAFHLGNGLWGFAIAWGLVTGQRSQDLLWRGCMVLAVGVAFMGINAILAFRGSSIQLFEMVH